MRKLFLKIYIRSNFYLFALILSSLLMIYQTYKFQTGYWYDEIIVTTISKQPVDQMLKMLRAEPHPPGYYLFLKLINTDNPKNARMSIVSINQILVIFVMLWLINNKHIEKYKLEHGLFLFFISPFWMSLASSIKQDSITTLLFIIGIIVALEYIQTKSEQNLIKLTVLCILSLFFGYINFLKVFTILLYLSFSRYSRLKIWPSAVIMITLLLYVYELGADQIVSNINRFSWHRQEYMGLLALLKNSVGGITLQWRSLDISDIFLVTSLLLFVISVIDKKVRNNNLLLFFVNITIIYSIYGIAKSRYVVEIIIIYFIFVGWGLNYLFLLNHNNKHIKTNAVLLVLLYLIVGQINLRLSLLHTSMYKNLSILLGRLTSVEKTGMLERHPIEPIVRKEGYYKASNNAVPLSIFTDLEGDTQINGDVIKRDGMFVSLSHEEIEKKLVKTGLKRFIYLTNLHNATNYNSYYDPDNSLYRVLNNFCNSTEVLYKYDNMITIFDSCETELKTENNKL